VPGARLCHGNKHAAADSRAVGLAAQQGGIRRVPIKIAKRQALQPRTGFALNECWRMVTINALRGLLYEFGITLPQGKSGNNVYQDNYMAYDTLGRLRWVSDGRALVNIDYDKVGNRTHIDTHVLTGDTTLDSSLYFKYDAMNRQTVVNAVNAAGDLGTKGHAITYDKNGNRLTDTWYGNKVTPGETQTQITGYDAQGAATYANVTLNYVVSQGYTTSWCR
jgi:hypothetical protein